MLTEYDSVEFNKKLINYASSKGVMLFVYIDPRTLSAHYLVKKGKLATSYSLDYDLNVNFRQVIYEKMNEAITLLDQTSS